MKENDADQFGTISASGSAHNMVQRCIIITRDENGYGLTVSGDNPVFVQSVKEDGAAARAGVRQGDRIIKVNGTLVVGVNHMEVVQMITSGAYAALTLLGQSPSSATSTVNSNLSSTSDVVANPPTIRHSIAQLMHRQSTESLDLPFDSPTNVVVRRSVTSTARDSKSKDFITGPMPVDEEKQMEWRKKRKLIICQMLEEEKKHVEELLVDLKRNSSDKTQHLLEQAQKKIKNLENQLFDIKTQGGEQHIHPLQSSVEKQQGSKTVLPLNESQRYEPSTPANAMNRKSSSSIHKEGDVSSNFPTSDGLLHYVAPAQVDISPMEESDSDTEAVLPLETDGPFVNFAELKNRPAHLAVFLHYLLSNCDPSSLLFYLITDLYCYGNTKEMRKWAYEIHSTFIVPMAPLRVSSVDMTVVQEIDTVLQCLTDSESDDALKRIFIRARQKALDEVNELLADFRNKRTLGLGNVFGESLLQNLNPGDTNRERKIIESLLMQHFDSCVSNNSDFEQLHDRQQALAIALATILKHMGVKPSILYQEKLLDKCPMFITKEKKGFLLLSKPSKKAVQIKGHHFVLNPIYVTTVCYQCQEMIWGVNPQGYFCSNCDVIVHKICAGSLEDVCYGGGKGKAKRINPKLKVPRDDSSDSALGLSLSSSSSQPLSLPGAIAIVEECEDRTSVDDAEEMDKTTDLPNSPIGKETWASKSVSADSGYGGDVEKSTNINVGRSQSMKSREEQHRQSKRNCDNGGRRTKSDVDSDDKSIALAIGQENPTSQDISVSSSSSSVSHASLPESPTTSTDLLVRNPAESASTTATLTSMMDITLGGSDSDLEADNEIPRLDDVLDWETVKFLKPKEKRRQEVINEFFHTERTHVRNLKVVRRVFYEPLLSSGILTPDIVKLLFANIEEILDLHIKINSAMKSVLKQNKLVGDIGGFILPFFDGASGDQFRQAVATFCQHQQHALEALKVKQKKDQKLGQFLQEAECSSVCRKLQLKDMLPMEMQRLTKYPILLEAIAKHTNEPSEELEKLKRCIECAKGILDAVNTAKRNSENLRRLEDLHRRLDTREFDRVSHVMTKTYKNLDLRQYTLLHDGPLSWRLGKNKAVDLHVVLLDDLLVLLARNSDGQRLSLKFHNINVGTGKEDIKFTHCPLLKLCSLMAKDVATDKKAFFVVSTSAHGPQIYELVAQSTTEKKIWFKFITEQIDLCKQRDVAMNTCVSNLPSSAAVPIAGTKSFAGPSSLIAVSSSAPATLAAIDLASATDSKLNESNTVAAHVSIVEEEAPVERIQIVNQPRLINPSEVQVCQPTVLEHAQPVLTPIERLKRKDEVILRSLAEKYKIMSQLVGLPPEDLINIADLLVDNKGNKEAKELALASIVQTNRILEAINDSMKLKREEELLQQQQKQQPSSGCSTTETEESNSLQIAPVEKPAVPCSTLTRIAAPLMKHLSGLLHALQTMDDDVKRVRAELQQYKSMENASGGHSQTTSLNVAALNANEQRTIEYEMSSSLPTLSVRSASSEETLTESKTQTPMCRSPASPGSHSLMSFESSTTKSNDRRSLSPNLVSSAHEVNCNTPAASLTNVPSTTNTSTMASSIILQDQTVQNSTTEPPQSFQQPLVESQSSDSLKSPESGDDEKKREKRRQRRQRHTALSGLEGVIRAGSFEESSSVSPIKEEDPLPKERN